MPSNVDPNNKKAHIKDSHARFILEKVAKLIEEQRLQKLNGTEDESEDSDNELNDSNMSKKK